MDEIKLMRQLEELRVTGPGSGHPRLKNMLALQEVKQGAARSLFGLPGLEALSEEAVLKEMASLNGCSANLLERDGDGYMDPRLTLAGMKRAAGKIRQVCARQGRILFGTGHPGAMLGFYFELLKLVRELGGVVVCPGSGLEVKRFRCPDCGLHDVVEQVDYVGDVATVTNGEGILHRHDEKPCELIIDAAKKAAESLELVIGDHGFAGAALVAGLSVIAIMDTNDPAIAASRLVGFDPIIIPMDDNLPNSISKQVGLLFCQLVAETTYVDQ
ncbi:MAG TPA: phosphatase [Negativicutes bacterium]|nr:phosphatase [Negativicutes bacterium]